MYKNNLIKIVISIILHSFLFSEVYNITGIVLDSETKEPINNVNIFIDELDYGTTSNIDGYFELRLTRISDKTFILNIKIIGYKEEKISISLINDLIDLGEINLEKKPIELEELQIHSHKDKSDQISNILLSGSKLNENLKSNIASTLSNHSNIGINSFGSVTSKPAIRGLSGDRFLITKDGIETGDLSQSSIDHAIALDMTEVNQIEVIRGPKALAYGPNAIGGVINTNLIGNPKIRLDKFHQRYLIGSESFNDALYGNLMLYLPIKNNQLNLFISNRLTGNDTSPIGELKNTESKTTNYKIGFTNYSNHRYINFMIERFNMGYGIPPTSNGHIDGVDIFLLKDSYQFNYHQDISLMSFSQFDAKFNLIDYVHVELVNDELNNDNIFEIIDSSLYHVSLAKKTNNMKIELSSDNSMIGIEYNLKEFNPEGFYLTPITNETQLSFFGFHQKSFIESNLDLLGSFRLGFFSVNPGDYVYTNGNANLVLKDNDGNIIEDEEGNRTSLVRDREFRNLSFSFGLKKIILDKFELNSWLMHTMRSPMVEELYSDGPHLASYAFEIGNPNLEAEKIYGIENSISYKNTNYYSNIPSTFDFSLVTFYNYSPYFFEMSKDGNCEVPDDWQPWTTHPCYGADWIDWGSGGLGWLHKYSTKGYEVLIKGIEFDLGYKFGNFQSRYNFSFTHGDNKTLGAPLSYINPMKQILKFEYDTRFIKCTLRLSKIHSQNRLGEFETYTPGSFLTDFIIALNYKMHNMTVQVNNLFDEEHYNHLSRIKNITPESGRNFHLIYKVMF